jgi:hypothetical protein
MTGAVSSSAYRHPIGPWRHPKTGSIFGAGWEKRQTLRLV